MFAGSETFHFLSPNYTLMMSGVIYRQGGWETNPRERMFLDTHTHTQTASPAWGVEMPVSLEMPVEMLNSLFTHYLAKRQESWQMEVLKHINHLPLWADKHLIWLMTPEDQNKCREIKAGRGRRRGKLKRAHWPPGGLSGVQQGRLLLRLPVMCSCPHAD